MLNGKLEKLESKPKLKISIVDDSFEIDVEIIERIKVRRYLTIAVFAIAVILALVAAIYGFMTDDFDGLVAVGIFVDAPVMSILIYYYGDNHDDKEDKGPT